MKSNFFKVFLFLGFAVSLGMTSCSKEESDVTDSDSEYLLSQSRGETGECFEVVFPVSVSFPDGTTVEVSSREELRKAIKEWKASGGEGRPHLVFPIEVVHYGETVVVENGMQFRHLLRKCRMDRMKPCFKINFPIDIELPGGEVIEVGNRMKMRILIRRWKKNHPNADRHPEIVFPITVTMKDGSVQEVNSKEELQALKKACH